VWGLPTNPNTQKAKITTISGENRKGKELKAVHKEMGGGEMKMAFRWRF